MNYRNRKAQSGPPLTERRTFYKVKNAIFISGGFLKIRFSCESCLHPRSGR